MKRLAACGLLLLAACASRTPPTSAPSAPSVAHTAEQATHAVDRRDAAIRALRARFTATVASAGETRNVNGVVLVAKPDRLRFRLALPLGITVFDYLRKNDRAWLALPLGGNDKAVEYAREALPRMFDRLLSGRSLSRCDLEPAADGMVSVLCSNCTDTCRPDRAFLVRLADAAVEQDRVLAPGGSVSVTRYEDYHSVDSAYLPYRIVIVDERPEQRRRVEVTIDRYEVNPTLADDLFVPAPGSDPIPVE